MALSKDDILNAIAEMSVMEVVELVSRQWKRSSAFPLPQQLLLHQLPLVATQVALLPS